MCRKNSMEKNNFLCFPSKRARTFDYYISKEDDDPKLNFIFRLHITAYFVENVII